MDSPIHSQILFPAETMLDVLLKIQSCSNCVLLNFPLFCNASLHSLRDEPDRVGAHCFQEICTVNTFQCHISTQSHIWRRFVYIDRPLSILSFQQSRSSVRWLAPRLLSQEIMVQLFSRSYDFLFKSSVSGSPVTAKLVRKGHMQVCVSIGGLKGWARSENHF